ncbi:CRISPR-associated endoribonuclease Cas6 [bacterium]|nr:CRISPR-associated endoribonuclease Cas6 [bacterium]
MRLEILLQSERSVELPLHYNYIVQSFIYANLPSKLADKLHSEGFPYEKRCFRLFTFSRIIAKARREGDKLIFPPSLYLVISSPYHEMLEGLAETLVRLHTLRLARNELYLEWVGVKFTPQVREEETIRMLSPMTVYSTLMTATGGRKTYYYNPREEEFSRLIKENLIKKYKVIYGEYRGSEEFIIEPIKVGRGDEKIINYKGTWIKGWMGIYKIRGEPELIKLGWDAGLGAKNSQGFGCFEILREEGGFRRSRVARKPLETDDNFSDYP